MPCLSLPSSDAQQKPAAQGGLVMWSLEISLPGIERGGEWQTENGHHSLLRARTALLVHLGRQG